MDKKSIVKCMTLREKADFLTGAECDADYCEYCPAYECCGMYFKDAE